jgi:hypothetical protein
LRQQFREDGVPLVAIHGIVRVALRTVFTKLVQPRVKFATRGEVYP